MASNTHSAVHEQNGSAERKNRHITEMGLTLLANTSLPLKFWGEGFTTAVHLINAYLHKISKIQVQWNCSSIKLHIINLLEHLTVYTTLIQDPLTDMKTNLGLSSVFFWAIV